MIAHVQAVLDELLSDSPPEAELDDPECAPWWSPEPAVHLAAVLMHVGLPEVAEPDGGLPPHAQQSAACAREVLRQADCPFTVREHAVALVRNRLAPASLIGSGALAETYMEYACALDLRALYYLCRAEARAAEDEDELARADAFREHVEGLDIFGRPQAPPLTEDGALELGYADAPARHRARNALRYFRLVARMTEPEWHRERLRQERERPPSRLHLLVGPAGSGKSSWALDALSETVIVSSDRMRRELTGDPRDQSQNYLVFQRCMDRVREELHRGREVTFDATNYSRDLRTMPLQAGRWSGAEIVSYFFDVGLEDALRRNRARDRLVPEPIIRRHYCGLEPPALHEADRHVVVAPGGQTSIYWPAPELRPTEEAT